LEANEKINQNAPLNENAINLIKSEPDINVIEMLTISNINIYFFF